MKRSKELYLESRQLELKKELKTNKLYERIRTKK